MFITLLGPEQFTLPDGQRVRYISDYLAWHRVNLNPTARGEHVWSPLPASVEHGRWLCHCVCGAGLLTRPELPIACCIWCGNIYERIEFPKHWRDIERVLLLRPMREQQNWIGESVATLIAENAEHSIGVS